MFAFPACFLNRCYLLLYIITSLLSNVSGVASWELSASCSRFPPKNPLISQKVAQKLLKESHKFFFCSESCSKVVLKNCTVVCADCLLPLVAVTEVIMASSNINKLSMMISSTSSRDQICQKLLSCLRKRGWYTFAWYFQALRPPPPQTSVIVA